jgi:hypothetical protein
VGAEQLPKGVSREGDVLVVRGTLFTRCRVRFDATGISILNEPQQWFSWYTPRRSHPPIDPLVREIPWSEVEQLEMSAA